MEGPLPESCRWPMHDLKVTSWPATGHRANEDCAVVSRDVAVVVDGAGLPASMRSGCRHTVAWYARQLAHRLHQQLGNARVSLRRALRAAIADLAQAHMSTCDLAAGSPSATVAAWRMRATTLEYLVLSDSSVILLHAEGRHQHVTDDRLDRAVARGVDALLAGRPAAAAPLSSVELRAVRRGIIDAQRNTPDGFWCCHHDPSAADEARTGSVALSSLTGAVLATDGAVRGAHLLHAHTLAEMAALAVAGRHGELLGQIRRAECEQRAFLSASALKHHDDATVVSARIGPPRPAVPTLPERH